MHKQKGAIEVLLMVFLAIALGSAGYFYWGRGKDFRHFINRYVAATLVKNTSQGQPNTPCSYPPLNSIYLVKYQGVDTIFLTTGVVKCVNNFIEGKIFEHSSGYWLPFQYADLENPKKIYSDNRNVEVLTVLFDGRKENVYLSMFYYDDDLTDDVVIQEIKVIKKIQLSNGDSETLWENPVKSFGYNKGPAIIEKILEDRYLLFKMYDCSACEPDLSLSVLLNIETKNEVVLGEVGNIDIEGNRATFQKLMLVKESCTEDLLACSNGEITFYEPLGDILKVELP